MDHVIWPDWSMGSVHVTGAILLAIAGESLHDQGMLSTCTQREGSLVLTG